MGVVLQATAVSQVSCRRIAAVNPAVNPVRLREVKPSRQGGRLVTMERSAVS